MDRSLRGAKRRTSSRSAAPVATTTESQLEPRSLGSSMGTVFASRTQGSPRPTRLLRGRNRLLGTLAGTEGRDRRGGRARLGIRAAAGHEVAIAALDFGFLGGSMGVVVGEKLVRIAERARERRLPLLSISASGGARMQEGMLSLLQMAKTTAAVQRLREAGCPYISILAHPTTGGVFASFANLGDIILAEPGALIGFAGPRVAEQIIGRKLPEGSHTAEFLLAHGMVDAIVDRREQWDYLVRCLTILTAPRSGFQRRGHTFRSRRNGPDVPAWDAVQRARGARRLTSVDYLQRMLGQFVELHGDRSSGTIPRSSPGLAHSMAKPSPSLHWNEVISKTASGDTTVALTRRAIERRAG